MVLLNIRSTLYPADTFNLTVLQSKIMSDHRPSPEAAGGSGPSSTLGKAFSKLDLEGHNYPPSPAPSSPRNGRKYALATELVYTENGDQYNSSSMPIYQVRFSCENES